MNLLLSYIIKRILMVIPVLLGVSFVSFAVVHLIPGDPAQVMLGNSATPEAIRQLREQLGLNLPLYQQYLDFLGNVFQGNLGVSLQTQQPIAQEIIPHIAATAELAIFSMVFATVFGINLGILAAWKKNSYIDYLVMVIALIGVSIPVFWFALMEQWLFGLKLHILPVMGQSDITSQVIPITNFYLIDSLLEGNIQQFWSGIRHLMLPGIALGSISMAMIARMTRASMVEVMEHDYIRTAKAKGMSNFNILYKQAFKNSFGPVLTVIGLSLGGLLGGAVLAETIFGWPGLGLYIYNAIGNRDYPVIQAGVLITSTIFIIVNLIVDILYTYFNPKITYK